MYGNYEPITLIDNSQLGSNVIVEAVKADQQYTNSGGKSKDTCEF